MRDVLKLPFVGAVGFKEKMNHTKICFALCTILAVIKDYRDHDFPNTEFSYFLTIDTR